MIPLDKNESYWLLDEELRKAFQTYTQNEFSTYPNYNELKKQIAEYSGVIPEQLCLTPGSDAAIQTLAELYVNHGREAVLPVPTFYGYESILDRVGGVTHPVYYTETDGAFVFPLADTLTALRRDTAKALFLCQPNNPLGCSIPEETIERIVTTAQESDVLLVSDEAYFEFSGKTLLPFLLQTPHLVIIRTLSKGFGLSGARVGYCIAAPEIIRKMEQRMLPWPIAHMSMFAAEEGMRRTESIRVRRQMVIQERDYFSSALSRLSGIRIYSSETNFILIRVPNAHTLADELRAKGVRVAIGESMSKFTEAKELLHSTLRMGVPSPKDMPFVLDIFSTLFPK
ncbi:histidinol-phosphate aminotransferase family protein [Patescibacteria group bacterium]|nr:histidinol-phosphate aminotransferase family protein [Patescibacteria group bacterium]